VLALVGLGLAAPATAQPACKDAHALALAVAGRPVTEVEALLESGLPAEPAPECVATRSPLEVAAERGRTDVVRVLLGRGASVRRAPLWAAAHDDPELMGLLIDALPEAERAAGLADGLEGAATRGHTAVIRALLARGAEPARGSNALEYAAAAGHVEAVRLLVRAAFDPADPRAFAAALAVGDAETLRQALERGADPHALDSLGDGGNALSRLAGSTGPDRSGRDVAIAELLLEREVDPNVPHRGVLPLTLARERGNEALALRLEQAGAREGTSLAWKLGRVGSAVRGAGVALMLLLGGGL
jgi:ankyrin repeat protein